MEAIKKKMNLLKDKLKLAEEEANESEDELYAKQAEADQAEELVLERTKELNDIEDDLEKEEDNLVNLKNKYDEAVKLSDENERAHKELSNRGQVDTVKLDHLESEICELHVKMEKVEDDYQEKITILEDAETELDTHEERYKNSDERVKELEADAVQTGNLLRSMEIAEGVSAKSESKSSCKLDECKENVDCKILEAEEKEEEAGELEKALTQLDQDVQDARDRYQQVKCDYDALLAEVAEI